MVRLLEKLAKSSLPWVALVCSFPMASRSEWSLATNILLFSSHRRAAWRWNFPEELPLRLGAFHDIVQGFLKARVIAVAPKIQVVMATAAGVWDAQIRKLNTVYMRALRAAMGKDRGPHLNVTDLAVRIEAGVPSISTVVRRARLKLVARVAAADCDALKALTQDPHILAGEFFGEVKRDLVCLHDFDRRLSSLPSPGTGLDQWSRFWRTAGRYWKRYVSVHKSPADVKGVELSSPSVMCEQCGKAFRTNAALKVHGHRVAWFVSERETVC